MSGEEFRDSKVLAHLEEEGGTGELELENVTVVVDLLLADDFKLGLDFEYITPFIILSLICFVQSNGLYLEVLIPKLLYVNVSN